MILVFCSAGQSPHIKYYFVIFEAQVHLAEKRANGGRQTNILRPHGNASTTLSWSWTCVGVKTFCTLFSNRCIYDTYKLWKFTSGTFTNVFSAKGYVSSFNATTQRNMVFKGKEDLTNKDHVSYAAYLASHAKVLIMFWTFKNMLNQKANYKYPVHFYKMIK